MVAIIDYGAGNLQSVTKALQFIGCEPVITSDRDTILAADHCILPGVGSFGDCMTSIRKAKLENTIHDFADSGKPFLGICLGLQMLFEESDESAGHTGLGIFPGKIRRIPADSGLKIPHIGWNSLDICKRDGVFANLPENPYVYFVHSYYLHAEDPSIVSARTSYGVQIDAAVQFGNVHATQFHPEKSGAVGLQIMRNFISLKQIPTL